jgi:hypothetical protein
MDKSFEKITALLYKSYHKAKGLEDYLCDIDTIKKKTELYEVWGKFTLLFLDEFTKVLEDEKQLENDDFEIRKEYFLCVSNADEKEEPKVEPIEEVKEEEKEE